MKPDLDRARQLVKESGYDGRPIVILHVTDIAHQNGAAVVTRRRLESIGFNVGDKAMDWSTNLTMRARKEPPSKGGWNIMHSWNDAVEVMNPVVHRQLSFGVDIPQIEKLVTAWVRATDQRKRKAIADILKFNAPLFWNVQRT